MLRYFSGRIDKTLLEEKGYTYRISDGIYFDVSKFADIADARMRELFPETNLKRIRSTYGCSQAELARKSGVSLRSIQMYEQRNKDINKASADTLYRIAKVLGCTMEDLLER